MITSLIPKKAKAWIRSKLAPRPIELMKYYPYLENSESYAIPNDPPSCEGICELGLPIPPEHLWRGYDEYLSSGKRHVGKMLDILKEAGFSLNMGSRILDFGCAAGRMIRWLKDTAAVSEVWGTDVSAEHITWCKQHLSPPFNFATNTTLPHLPFEDRYFDLIYAGSVFTHIDDLADSWFLELRRVLSTDGRLYVTVHDKNTIKILNEQMKDDRLSKLMRSGEKYMGYATSDFGMFTIGRRTSSNVFYDIDFLHRILGPHFDVVSVTREAYGYQTAVLLARR
jgi:SAM-dependent methyltransferase